MIQILIMEINRKFVISCPIFGGFERNININDYNNIDEIVEKIINELHNTLKNNNFNALISKFNETKYNYPMSIDTIISVEDGTKVKAGQ